MIRLAESNSRRTVAMDAGSESKRMLLQQDLLERARRDQTFRARLLAEPKAVIADEFEIVLPDDFVIEVLEEKPDKLYFILPANRSELSDEQLEMIAAGARSYTTQTGGGGHNLYTPDGLSFQHFSPGGKHGPG